MTVLFRACHDRPAATDLERWRESVDRTFGPVRLRPAADAAAHLAERLVVGDVGAVRVSEMTIRWDSPAGSCHAARTPRLIRQAELDPEQYRIDVRGAGGCWSSRTAAGRHWAPATSRWSTSPVPPAGPWRPSRPST